MSSTLTSDEVRDALRARLKERRLVIVAGAGVSAAATAGDDRVTWRGFLEHGLGVAGRVDPHKHDPQWTQRVAELLASGSWAEWLEAAEAITKRLGGRESTGYARWLRDGIGSMEVRDPTLIQALARLRAPIVTTNYDGLIERETGYDTVTWRDEPDAIEKALEPDSRVVFHLHGYWEDPLSVVFDPSSIKDFAHARWIKSIVESHSRTRSFLLVGLGTGLDHPSFADLREWMRNETTHSGRAHFRLAPTSEAAAHTASHEVDASIDVVDYGTHEELPAFIAGLAPSRSYAFATRLLLVRAAARRSLPFSPILRAGIVALGTGVAALIALVADAAAEPGANARAALAFAVAAVFVGLFALFFQLRRLDTMAGVFGLIATIATITQLLFR